MISINRFPEINATCACPTSLCFTEFLSNILAALSVYSQYHKSFLTSGVLQSQSTTSVVGAVTEEATSSEEIPAETLQCPLPEPSRAYPFCQENVVVRY